VVGSRPTAADAQALAERLTSEGMPAAVFHEAELLSEAKRFLARNLRAQDAGVAAARKDGAQLTLPWGDVAAILVGVRKTLAFVDVIDEQGAVLCARERDTQFEGSGLPASGGRAGVLALAQLLRARTNGRFDDRLMKPATIAQVCGPFASSPVADELAETILLRAVRS
jgi:hypothetical protein